ncbi:MAG: O-succinylbenzoic acid--CoA ligase, partial [Cyclobacteriaceae bacterium]
IQLEALLEANISLDHFKCILVGGAPVGETLRKKLSAMDLNVFETYGMTETVSHIAVRRLSGPKIENAFTVIHELELSTDERGCLRIRGQITKNHWLQTNDRVDLLDNKRFRWLGRADWVINSGGIKLQPEHIEARIRQAAAERGWNNELFIHGFPHPEFGECAVLIFEGDMPVSRERIYDVLSGCLERYEVPKHIAAVPKFKRSETHKLLRKETAKLLAPFTF